MTPQEHELKILSRANGRPIAFRAVLLLGVAARGSDRLFGIDHGRRRRRGPGPSDFRLAGCCGVLTSRRHDLGFGI